MREEADDPHDAFPADETAEADEAELPLAEQKALRVLEACDDFIMALLIISEASGPDHPDDFERAYLCIKRMHKIAANALMLHGFEPRRMTID